MNVKEFISIIENEVKEEDRENAEIEIWCDEVEYKINSMKGFSISPDIVINIVPIDGNGIKIKPMNWKKEKDDMIKAKMNEINEEIVK